MKKISTALWVITLAATLFASGVNAYAGQWVTLFNGVDIEGWVQKGGEATYKVEDGCIVGTTKPRTPNSFLCPPNGYGDFELTFEVKCDRELNSGVQIRSASSVDEIPAGLSDAETAKAKKRADGNSLFGPQVEIAANGNAAGVWFEGVGGWLLDPKPEVATKAYAKDGWNKYRVLAKGETIKVWINDTLVSDGKDTRTNFASGRLGFQVHGVGQKTEPLSVRWKNIKIRELEQRPNVLFILTDDQRYDALSCMGHPYLKTPHIDRLADEGLLFRNHFCTTSLCSPSRASILSGLYAHTHGVSNNFTEYPNGMVSFPMRLQESGYETAYVGKWHMGEKNDMPRPGFNHFVTHKGQGQYFDTEFNFNGNDRRVVEGYYTTVVTDMAMDWIKDRESDKPWAIMVGHKAPHSFYFPEEKYEHAFDSANIQYPKSAFNLDDKPAWFKKRLDTWHGIYGPLFDWRKDFPDESPEAVKDFAKMVRAYWGTLLSVDDSVGRLYEFLEERGDLDNTLVVFTSDNGLLEGEHGMVDKRTGHEPSIRIPLVVRYPGLTKQGKVVPQITATIDFAPTILDICGAEPLEKVHGQSWKRLAQGDDPDWRTSFYYEYNYEHQFPYTPNVRALRTDRWKYIRYPHGDGSPDRHMAELYDLQGDPEEDKNLISNEAHVALVAELRAELDRLIALHGDGKPDEMPMDQGIQSGLPEESIR
ncbi:MAG: sulfatase-like hydrolase/transferase [Planctomycetota bacterium]